MANIDLKNLNLEDIKNQILKFADKKTLIRIGIGFGGLIFFLIIYYAVINPIVEKKRTQLNDMNKKKEEIVKNLEEIKSMKAKIKKLRPKYENYSSLFHTRAEVEGLYQTLSVFAAQNDLVITRIEKKKIKQVGKSEVLKKKGKKKKKKKKKNQSKSKKNIAYYLIPVDFEIDGSFIGYKVTDSSEQAPATRRGTMFASAEGSSLLISTMIDEAKHMMTSPMFTLGLTSSCDKGINALKQLIVDTIKAEAKVKKKTASKGSDVVKLFLAYIPKAMDRVRAGVFLQNMTDNQIINVLKAKDEEVDNFCAAVFEDEA